MRTKPPLNRKALCQRLRTARTSKNLNGDQLSELCGINPGYYRKIEGGSRDISLTTLLKFCNALEVSPDYLLGYTYAIPSSVAARKLSPKDQALLHDLNEWLSSRLSEDWEAENSEDTSETI